MHLFQLSISNNGEKIHDICGGKNQQIFFSPWFFPGIKWLSPITCQPSVWFCHAFKYPFVLYVDRGKIYPMHTLSFLWNISSSNYHKQMLAFCYHWYAFRKKSGDARLHLSLLSQFQPQTGTWFILSENTLSYCPFSGHIMPMGLGTFPFVNYKCRQLVWKQKQVFNY